MGQTERIACIIREYDAQGWHRTGTETDVASARWLAEKARACGLETDLESLGLSRIDPDECFIEAEGRQVTGLPLFDGGFTGADGIRGRVGPVGSKAEIGVVEAPPSELDEAFDTERETPRHLAYVLVTLGGRPGLAVRNAPRFLSPFGPPVLQVTSEARDWLAELAQSGSESRLVASATRSRAESYNVVAGLQGRDRSLQPIVVMTPRSGWWRCAAERGGGIACWLEVMLAMNDAGCPRDVLFVATTGHELGVLGIRGFLDHRPNIVAETAAWVHFGASIGAARDPHPHLAASDAELQEAARNALARCGAPPVSLAPRGTMVGVESTVVHRLGARCVAMAGGHALFHMEDDRWPDAVDVEAVAGYASAFAEVASELARSGE